MDNGNTNGDIKGEAVVSYANQLLAKCNIDFKIEDSVECTSDLFLAFYHAILGDFPSGSLVDCRSVGSQVHNVKCIVETLSEDYLKVDLAHISPEDVVAGDLLSIYNLIEILDGLLDYLLEKITTESDSGDEGDIDSDQLSENAKAMALETIQREMAKVDTSGVEKSLSSTAELIALGRSVASTDTESNGPQRDFVELKPETSFTDDNELSDHTLHASHDLSPHESLKKMSPTEFSGVPSEPDSFQSLPDDIKGISSTLSKLQMDEDTFPKLPQHPPPLGPIPTTEETPQSLPHPISPPCVPKTTPDLPRHIPSPSSTIDASDSVSSLDTERRRQALDVHLDDKHTSFVLKKKDRLRSGGESSASESVDVADGGGHDDTDDASSSHLRSRGPPTPKEKDWQAMLDNLQRTVEESKRIREEYFSSTRTKPDLRDTSDEFQTSPADETMTTEDTLDDSYQGSPSGRRKNVRFEDTISTKTAKELAQFRQLLKQEKALQDEKKKLLSRSFGDHLDEVRETENSKLEPLRRKTAQSERKMKSTLHQQRLGKMKTSRRSNLTDAAKWKSWLSPSKVRPQPSRSHRIPPKRTSSEPVIGSGVESINEYDLLPKLLEEFPQLELPAATLNDMWQKQFRQIEHLTKAAYDHKNKKRKSEMQLHEAHLRHELLTGIMQKDHDHTRHLRDVRERVTKQKEAQRILRDRRLQTARIRKYYKDYHLQMKSRMMKRRTKEERIFKRLFEDGLEIQRARLRELRKYARDKREEQQKRQMDEIQSLENYYRDQFNILAETLAREKHDLKVRDEGQMKLIRQMKRGLRQKMEKEIENLQDMITRDDEDAYFREIEADRLRRQLQLATYHAKFHD